MTTRTWLGGTGDYTGNRLPTPVEVSKPNFAAPDGIYMSPDLTGFQPFYGTSAAAPDAAAVAALMLQADPSISPAQVTSFLQQSAVTLNQPADRQGAGLVQAVDAVNLALAAACYAAGTHILTDHGERPVEMLRPGDYVLAGNALRKIRWVGRTRVTLSGHPDPDAVLPIRITAGGLAPNQPHRDLLVSPDHAILIDEILIPAYRLLNGATIRRDYDRATVDYHHIELDTHDLLLAEGVRAESYLDTGNRALFDHEACIVEMFPRLAAQSNASTCRPLHLTGPRVAAAHATLLARAETLGHRLTDVADFFLCADGRRLPSGAIPAGTRELRLRSRSAIPAELGLADDRRRLGVPVVAIRLDGQEIPLTALVSGCHPLEHNWRWTDGNALLRLPHARAATIEIITRPGWMTYWRTPAASAPSCSLDGALA